MVMANAALRAAVLTPKRTQWPAGALHVSTFTAPDGTALSAYVPEVGGPWTKVNGTPVIQGGEFTSGDTDSAASIPLSAADIRVAFSLRFAAVDLSIMQIFFGPVNGLDALLLQWRRNDSQIRVSQIVGGATTLLNSAGFSFTASACSVAVVRQGGQCTISMNGVLLVTASVPFAGVVLPLGFRLLNAAGQQLIDDLVINSL